MKKKHKTEFWAVDIAGNMSDFCYKAKTLKAARLAAARCEGMANHDGILTSHRIVKVTFEKLPRHEVKRARGQRRGVRSTPGAKTP